MDTELIGTSEVKGRLALCDGLYSYIKEKDKEPIWDGHIYVYSKNSDSNDDLIARVPVQAKGEKIVSGKKTATHRYSEEIVKLKHYLYSGGVIYFVVTIDDSGSKTIFYRSLLPYDLHWILKDIDEKRTTSFTLHILPNDDDAIRQIFIAFIEDRKRQATQIIWTEEQAREAVRNGASIKFHIQPKKSPMSFIDVMKETTTQSFYLYVEIKEGVEFVFAKVAEGSSMSQGDVAFPVYVNGVKYYDSISHGYENGQAFLHIGQAFKLPIAEEGEALKKRTLKYALSGTLASRIADSDFILALSNAKEVVIGDAISFDLSINNPEEVKEMQRLNTELKIIKTALDYFGVQADLDMDGLTDADYSHLEDLVHASQGIEMTFKETDLPALFYSNKKIGNIVIRTLTKKEDNSDAYRQFNAFSDEALVKLELVMNDGERVIIEPWSLFIHMKAEDFLCSNMDYFTVLNSIISMKPCDRELAIRISDDQYLSVNTMLLEIICAYDSQVKKDERLLQFAEDMSKVILGEDPVTIINMYQIIRRKRQLLNDEIASLVTLRSNSEGKAVKCALAILLGESSEANALLDDMTPEERRQITDYPIYKLLT